MQVQIEITTVCNFKCFYCAGRDMPQKHMGMGTFDSILAHLPPGEHRISLQGEGEPTLHPSFWEMVRRVKALRHVPYTITNGSRVDITRFLESFPKIGLSVDSLDPEESRRIGRFDLADVLANLQALVQAGGPRRVMVHSVDYGQDLVPLAAFVKALGVKHIVQPLQPKQDYARRYPDRATFPAGQCTFSCRYLSTPLMRYYSIDGIELPCCFIKDASAFVSIDHLRRSFDARVIPPVCSGCQEIYA